MRSLIIKKYRLHLLFYLYLLSASSLLLSGCLSKYLDPETEYTLAGLKENECLNNEIEAFLKKRTANIDTTAKKGEDILQQETYHERQLRDGILEELISKGYYEATVSYSDDPRPWTGIYTINNGQRYKIHKISVTPAKYTSFLEKNLQEQPLNTSTVLTAQKKLYSDIAKGQCFFDLAIDHKVTLDPEKKEADILFIVKAGSQAKMGSVTFKGNDTVKESYLQKLVTWKEGDCFQRKKIESLRAKLLKSGLFSSAKLIMPKQPLKNSHVPVTLHVKERAFRSVRAGVSYYSDEGLGLTTGWKHRNLFGAAENLDTRANLSENLQTIEANLTKPFFLLQSQSLSFNTKIGHEKTNSYTKAGMDIGAAVKRTFSKNFSGSTGASLSMNEVEDKTIDETNTFYLLSLPQSLTYNKRNSVLDATKGFLISGKLEPFFDLGGESPSFLKTEVSASAYHALNEKITAAFRIKTGSIFGPDASKIPATKRFYAGGGGSVRGFGYQRVGPLKDDEPEGGLSLIEASTELRFKITGKIGAVAFIDTGNVYNTSLADFDNLYVGGGGGLRYYTKAGPLRLDIAVPINKKETTPDNYQLYMSIGQAF